MDNHLKRLTDFFQQVGAGGVAHSEKTYLAHAVGVYNDLKRWGCDPQLCDAGLFHSIYGTELFQRFALPVHRRQEVRNLIGERAERLAYLNCAMDRTVFDETVAEIERASRREPTGSNPEAFPLASRQPTDSAQQLGAPLFFGVEKEKASGSPRGAVFSTGAARPPYRFRDRLTGEEFNLSADEFRDLCTIQVCDWIEQVERSGRWDYRREAYRQMARLLGGVAWQSYEQAFAKEPS